MKKVVGAILGVAFVGFVGYKIYDKVTEDVSHKKKSSSYAVAIDTAKTIREDIRDMRLFTGSLEPISTYNVSSKVGGYWVEQGRIEIGDKIEQNGFIGKIDDVEYVQDYEQAKANYEVTNAQLEEAKSILDLRKREYQRQIELFKITSKAELETAEFAEKSQAASVKVKEAELSRQAAVLNLAKIRLGDTVITNSNQNKNSQCYIASKQVELGDLITPNQVLVQVIDISKLNAKINVIEKDYGNIYIGQKAEIQTDAYPNKVFTGEIKQIAKSLNSTSRQAAVEIIIDNKDIMLKPGMFVRVYLEFSSHKNAQLLPKNAVVKQHGIDGVFTLDIYKAEANFVPVKTGIVVGENIEILSPANITKPVITLGNHLLVDNSKVILPKEFEAKNK